MPRVLREALEATVFITRRDAVIGTGFLVGIPDDANRPPVFAPKFEGSCYVVTARHLQLNREGLGVRINDLANNLLTVPIEGGHWWASENEAADVAVAYLPPNPLYERHMVHVEDIAEEQWLAENVGIGDQVETIGLFSGSPGMERITPIVRFGHIARMNEEPTRASFHGLSYDLDAIKVEIQSWPGQSGSPAFVVYPRVISGMTGWQRDLGLKGDRLIYDFAMLGVVSGHWEVPASLRRETDPSVVSLEEAEDAAVVRVNTGIALVIPGQHILDVLNREDVAADRKERRTART